MACDICGKTGCSLDNLTDQYKTEKIQSICGDCSIEVNNHLWDLRKLSMGFVSRSLVRFMENKKEKRTK